MGAPKDPAKYQQWLDNKSKAIKGKILKPESRIRKWFERLKQRPLIKIKRKSNQIPWNKGKKVDLSKYPNYGMSGKKHNEETKKIIGLQSKARPILCSFKGHKHGPNHNKWMEDEVKLANATEKRAAKLRGRKYSPEHCKAISESLQGRIIIWGDKMSEGKKKAYSQGKKYTPWNKGKKGEYKMPEGTGEKISKALKGKNKPPRSQEHCEKLRVVGLTNNSRKGKKHKPETIEKIKAKRAEQILLYRDSKPERIMQIALSLNGIKYKKHKVFKDGKGFYHQVDIFIEPNICVEVDGDYIHANPLLYGPEMRINGRYTAGQKWMRDKDVNEKLESLGNVVIRFWENKINKDVQICIEQIIAKISVKEVK